MYLPSSSPGGAKYSMRSSSVLMTSARLTDSQSLLFLPSVFRDSRALKIINSDFLLAIVCLTKLYGSLVVQIRRYINHCGDNFQDNFGDHLWIHVRSNLRSATLDIISDIIKRSLQKIHYTSNVISDDFGDDLWSDVWNDVRSDTLKIT